MADIKEIADQLVSLSIKEANELAQHLEEEYDIKPAQAAVAVGGGAGGNGEADGEAEEKSAFDVVLTGIGGNKIKVIKEVRTMTGLGLKEAKELVDNAPNTINEAVPKEEAEEMKAQLEDVGAEVELQ